MTTILPIGSKASEDTDQITARRYAHLALGDRPVVRLVTESLGPAEDLSAEFLGFAAPVRSTVVGVGKRVSLGFPAWALVHDPTNAHHALNLVKDIEKLARTARSKPGAAKDGFTALGEKLGKSAPQLLPSFYEQAGRVFIELGNTSYAGMLFGRGQEARDVHNLPFDPAHQREVCLEFAFAGALTAKALSQYARTLAEHQEPEVALAEFVTLSVERIKGGLPPYTGMYEDIARLAKAAGHDVTEVSANLLREVLFTPSISKAGKRFWQSYKPALVKLSARQPDIRHRLLAIVPDDTATHEAWLDILAESGATKLLTEPGGQPAGWLSRFAASRGTGWAGSDRSTKLLDLVSAMAERLRADGVQVKLFSHYYRVDLDLLDLCLAERIPLKLPKNPQPQLSSWLNDEQPGRRDLSAIAEHQPALLRAGIDGLFEYFDEDDEMPSADLTAILESPGLRTELRAWLVQQAGQIRGESLFVLRESLNRIRPIRTGRAFADIPETVDQIAGTNVAHTLAATLRTGIFDEFGWPAWEEAVGRCTKNVDPGDYAEVSIAGEGWPAIILWHKENLIVVGPDGILLEHVVRIPAELRRYAHLTPQATYVDGQLLVTWESPNKRLGYWSNDPETVFPVSAESAWPSYQAPNVSLAVPGGGRATGDRVLHVGDTDVPVFVPIHSDGTKFWRLSDKNWHEVDPTDPTVDRISVPSWIEGFDLADSWLRPAVPGGAASPIGVADGLHGWRVRRQPDGSRLAERIDGIQVTVPESVYEPRAALKFPGTDAVLVLAEQSVIGYEVLDATGTRIAEVSDEEYRAELSRGTVLIPPHDWWVCLRVRDEAGSLALRAMTEDKARRLLAGEDLAEVLPEITHPELAAGVRGMVEYAAALQRDVSTYRDLAIPTEEEQVDNGTTIHEALCWTDPPYSAVGNSAILSALTKVGTPDTQVGEIDFDSWHIVVTQPAAAAWRAASPLTPPEHRTALITFLRALADSGILDGGWRAMHVVPKEGQAREGIVSPAPDGCLVIWEGDWLSDDDEDGWDGLQFSTGAFALPKGWELNADHVVNTAFGRAEIAQFCDALEANGPIAWQPALVSELANATGLSEGDSAYLLAGLPGVEGHSNVLDAATRKLTGITTAAEKSARSRFSELKDFFQMQLLAAAIPADPTDLWTTGANIAGLADEWVRKFGRRVPVPDDILANATKQLPFTGEVEMVSGALNPDVCQWLTTDGDFLDSHLTAMRNVLPWLAYHLPAASPLRAQLPRALELVRDRLRHPDFVCQIGYVPDDEAEAALVKLLNLPPGTKTHVDGWLRLHDDGWDGVEVHVHTSEYRPEQHAQLLTAVEALIENDDEVSPSTLPVILGDGISQACAQFKDVDPEVFFQDPSVSVPDLVAEVAAKYDVDADVAVLYLQLLALPDPTDANVARWTGWKRSRLTKARAALAETELVVTAKRARAGRSMFLPGAWNAIKYLHLPLETWKLPLFGCTDTPDEVIVPLGTVEDLFRRAWQRVLNGDVPTYEELHT